MTEERPPDVEEIKARLGEEIPVDEDPVDVKSSAKQSAIVDEFRNLGRQLGETLHTAWNSEERRQFESEMREGVQSFANELDKAFADLRESNAAQKARDEAAEIGSKIESGEIGQKAQSSVAQGLRWFSEELGKLANQFTPAQKEPPNEEAGE